PSPVAARATADALLRGLCLLDRAGSAPRPRDLARRSCDGPAETLDRGDRHARGETGEADRGLGPAIGAEDRTPDAHDPLGRLLLIDGVAAPADRGKLALESSDRRDGVPGARRELG